MVATDRASGNRVGTHDVDAESGEVVDTPGRRDCAQVSPMRASTWVPGGSRRWRASKTSPANPTIGPTPPVGALTENAGLNLAVLPVPGQRTD